MQMNWYLIEELDSGFDKVTAKTCVKIIEKVRGFEDEFWKEDLKMDDQELAWIGINSSACIYKYMLF